MKKSSVITGLLGAATLALPLSLWADDHEEADAPPPLTSVWMVVPKAGMVAEFYDAMAEHLEFRLEKGDSRSWQFFNVAVGHNMVPLQIRACCFDWADQDAYEVEAEEKGFNEHFGANVDQYIDHVHHYIDESDWKNSHWPDGEGNGPYYGVTTWTLKADRGAGTSLAIDQMSQLAKNEGWANADNNWLWMSQIGGKEVLALVSSYENYADMAAPDEEFFDFVAEKLGEEEAGKLFDAFSSGLADSDYTIWVRNKRLSPSDD